MGRSVLVVEDEQLILMEVAEAFEAAGARVLQARSAAEAVAHVDRIAAAVVDYGLAIEGDVDLCAALAERRVPFMFYTGYLGVDSLVPGAIVVQKPATSQTLLRTVAELMMTGQSIAG